MILLTILYNRMMDSGETAQAAPKGKRRTLRQKDRIPDDTLESIAPKKPNLSGPRTERMNIFCSCAFIILYC